jgi:3-deoxy-manno-octulosonate cytidylyltransferase (CMP-KDO synthetase)
MSLIIAIPARLGSTRLPNKPLLLLAGQPMVAHVIARAVHFAASPEGLKRQAQVILATDSPEIAAIGATAGVMVCMTRAEHATGTDRLAQCAEQLNWADDTIVVNLQGDEPLMPAPCVERVITLLETHRRASIATLSTPIHSVQELFDSNCVKVVVRADQRALYFSRAPIPYARDAFGSSPAALLSALPSDVPFARHIGLYAYRAGALRQLAAAPQSALERAESLEQLRALSLGMEIVVDSAPVAMPAGIDTAADLARVEALLAPSAAMPSATSEPATPQSLGNQFALTNEAVQRRTPLFARKILMVCMGNICRSPLSMAQAQKRAQEVGFSTLEFGSRGTYPGTARQPADLRTQAVARSAGINLLQHRAQPLKAQDFYDYDLLLAHDERNVADMLAICPAGFEEKIKLLLEFAPSAGRSDVPDPYHGDHEDFILAWQLIKQGVEGLLEALRA